MQFIDLISTCKFKNTIIVKISKDGHGSAGWIAAVVLSKDLWKGEQFNACDSIVNFVERPYYRVSVPIDVCDNENGGSGVQGCWGVGSPDGSNIIAIISVTVEVAVARMDENLTKSIPIHIREGQRVTSVRIHFRSTDSGKMLKLVVINDDG